MNKKFKYCFFKKQLFSILWQMLVLIAIFSLRYHLHSSKWKLVRNRTAEWRSCQMGVISHLWLYQSLNFTARKKKKALCSYTFWSSLSHVCFTLIILWKTVAIFKTILKIYNFWNIFSRIFVGKVLGKKRSESMLLTS